MNAVVLFLPGASGKAKSSRFDFIELLPFDVIREDFWIDKENLKSLTCEDIFAKLDTKISELKKHYDEVYLIAKSFGGGLALLNPLDVNRQVLLAPAIGLGGSNYLEIKEIPLCDLNKFDLHPKKPTVPTLVIQGDEDKIISLEHTKKLVKKIGAKLEIILGEEHGFDKSHEQVLELSTIFFS